MGQSSSYRIAVIAITLCLILAAFITILSTPSPENGEKGGKTDTPGTVALGNNTASEGRQTQAAPGISNRIRVLWYDSVSKTYTFRDYDQPSGKDPAAWTEKDLPDPENGTLQRQPAMVRFLQWDGTMEKMIGATYITDQETITNILNSYTLIAPPPAQNAPGPTATTDTSQNVPQPTPAPGMLIPTMSQPCDQGDGEIRISFGYTSRHNTQVSLPVGEKNRFSPGDQNRGQPIVFLPGIHKDVFTVIYPANGTNVVWSLMNTAVGGGNVPRLKAGLTIDPSSGYAPLTVRLTDRSAGGTEENPLTGMWDLGDGTTAEGNDVSHRYLLPNTYNVRRVVSTSCGTDTAGGVVSVFGTDFKAEPVPESPRTFRFSDSSTGSPEVWFWDFNDGFSSWETAPVHTFPSPGHYSVGLTVSGKSGSGSVVHTIAVE